MSCFFEFEVPLDHSDATRLSLPYTIAPFTRAHLLCAYVRATSDVALEFLSLHTH